MYLNKYNILFKWLHGPGNTGRKQIKSSFMLTNFYLRLALNKQIKTLRVRLEDEKIIEK